MTASHPTLALEVGQFSHRGRQRENNEDWLGAFQHEDQEGLDLKGALFLVADGMGGHRGGDQASRHAVDLIIRSYVKDPDQCVDASLGRAIQEANARLHSTALDQGAEGRARWGTTVVAAVVRHNQLWIANVGDSRAYLQRNGQLRQLSRDHTWAADLDDAPSGEWIGRHLITRALGLKPEVKVDLYRPRALQPGDLMLLCTDGLTGPVPDAEISAILARFPPQDAARALVAAANRHGGPDNISVIVVRVGGRRMEVEAPARPLEQLLRRAAWWRWLEDLRALIPVQDTRLAWALLILAALLITLALIMLILVLANVFPSNGPAIVHTWG